MALNPFIAFHVCVAGYTLRIGQKKNLPRKEYLAKIDTCMLNGSGAHERINLAAYCSPSRKLDARFPSAACELGTLATEMPIAPR